MSLLLSPLPLTGHTYALCSLTMDNHFGQNICLPESRRRDNSWCSYCRCYLYCSCRLHHGMPCATLLVISPQFSISNCRSGVVGWSGDDGGRSFCFQCFFLFLIWVRSHGSFSLQFTQVLVQCSKSWLCLAITLLRRGTYLTMYSVHPSSLLQHYGAHYSSSTVLSLLRDQ